MNKPIIIGIVVGIILVGLLSLYSEFFSEDKTLTESKIEFKEDEIPMNCTIWFDGCNNCQVMKDEVLACTKIACETYGEPRCIESFNSSMNGNIPPEMNKKIATDNDGFSRQDKEKCEKQGGEYHSGVWFYQCWMPSEDEGKLCTDSSQCSKICAVKYEDATEGMCTAFSGGCVIILDNGNTMTMCE